MNVDFGMQIVGMDGKPAAMDDRALTLGIVSAVALNNVQEPEGSLQRGSLALRIYAAGPMELAPEDAALIRKCLPQSWPPIVVAQAWNLLG